MTIEETIDGLRTLYLDKHTQSEIRVVGKDDGKDLFAKAEPLELVQIMSIVTLGWIDGIKAKAPGTVPNVLLIGVGGGSIANVLLADLPTESKLHLVELEPEVLQAAVDFFGVPMGIDARCTGEAADGAAVMRACSQVPHGPRDRRRRPRLRRAAPGRIHQGWPRGEHTAEVNARRRRCVSLRQWTARGQLAYRRRGRPGLCWRGMCCARWRCASIRSTRCCAPPRSI